LRLFRYVRITNSFGAVHFNSANSGFVQAMAIASTNNAEIPMPEQQHHHNAGDLARDCMPGVRPEEASEPELAPMRAQLRAMHDDSGVI
jgi:hypothetical protein